VRSVNGLRSGATLAELTVALLISGVSAVIGVAILVAAERRTRADGAADHATQSARDVARVLATEIEAALADSIFVRGDTALDIEAHVGASVVCVASGAALVLPGAVVGTGVPFTFWRQLPEAAIARGGRGMRHHERLSLRRRQPGAPGRVAAPH